MSKNKYMTEQPSNYDGLEKMDTLELLTNINHEDKGVPLVMEKAIPQIKEFVDHAVAKMKKGGRLFYIGAGTSGRLGVLDASECPPTFGVSDDWIIGLIAGGDKALRKAVENAEDDLDQAWKDLQVFNISENDIVLGIAASGTTPYVIGGIRKSKEHSILTGSIACNAHAPLSKLSDHPIELVVGPEFVTGSTRMKAGTAQKLALNMISTSIMIQLGRVRGNKMVDMQLSNKKLVDRGKRMLMEELDIDEKLAGQLLEKHKNIRKVLDSYDSQIKKRMGS
ncbi:MAG: N-acetylmuramic acid 6-phosphate etherase [Muricauda sp.]|uniref:N-acetylmuramic acid 6-phosphate etherase n=1 Tax=Flagellimonas sp. TaxID=2058762 RepID=UPI001B276C3F|nr:N-acetylmuramic acid 6-phosphate etherase [Allomuricauda sp.]MBO6533481.1 N-acetylmuramic acid 6-phosphate etherase [Allomuricauda sp.]MBO6588556.1 N-acetylmuramic acid 6-phosphate etherase [Allomuricauda sp.]MBO6618304.1 N-acetylmuramic acid 6-phosphate etherase [Allomuricauda sp.]MBO6644094.1 N-acetylmuramic acid 6-phosphate etherase [Allomuricauda sp.]MBO6746978.1 N-acetylmuramic acid 6-phosphate etherase [Allomuricauda sp.]